MDKNTKENINRLIVSIQNGNIRAIEELHSIIAPTIRYIALKYLQDDNLADDCVQDFWANINKIASKFIFQVNGFSYLCKVMTNLTINYYHKVNRDKKFVMHPVNYEMFDKSHIGDNQELVELQIAVESAMKKLSDTEKIIIQETYFQDKSIRSIAKELSISKTHVTRLKQSAQKKLEQELKDFIGDKST